MVKHFLSYFVLSFAGTKITPTRDLRMDVQSYAASRVATVYVTGRIFAYMVSILRGLIGCGNKAI